MKAKFGAIVVAGSGKLGGHVFSKNRGGAFMRTKVTPANARTSFQTTVRNRFAGLSQAWRGLTPEARDAWNSSVIDFARTDVFGDLRNPSGINLFQRLNNNLLQVAIPYIQTPPVPSAVQALAILSVAYSSALQTLIITLDSEVLPDTILVVSATAGVSPGKTSVNSLFRTIGNIGSTTVVPIDIADDYTAKFGDVFGVGLKIFVRVMAVNAMTGQTGVPTIASVIIPA